MQPPAHPTEQWHNASGHSHDEGPSGLGFAGKMTLLLLLALSSRADQGAYARRIVWASFEQDEKMQPTLHGHSDCVLSASVLASGAWAAQPTGQRC